ncbi:MAG: Spy/CpxP family protein refolding chaperone [Candidatus Rokuibacteriota bacterium]
MRPTSVALVVSAGALTMLGTFGTLGAAAWAQHGGHAGQAAPRHDAVACEADFREVIAEGRGFGLAFAADRNGYPGPLHVLELKDRLGLSAEQEAKVRALMTAMFAEARPRGTALLDAEARLERLFAAGAADEAAVRTAVAEVERARSAVRLVHLRTHLATRDLLTEAQRRAYHEARWGQR